ncbi:uncharacterized protein LOC126674887 [Mercurialis annua]|uniref:uncharacterized protein LOC126674887 n=1 Tax=Mercurialis annua TaxID=3986 RepID=UPI00215E64D7|nr:uncharacterized protein LOC126674887 [Mercurialis annua]
MDAVTSSADLSIGWTRAIEYLACFPQIDPSILHDLIDEAPEFHEDLGKNARERVALKCLEHLYTDDNTDAAANDTRLLSNPRGIFDLSHSCEDVLQSILKETSVSDLQTGTSNLFKWDIHHFIVLKRASMPISALQQLKDAILEGTNPHASSLRYFSGLGHGNDDRDGINVDTGNDDNRSDIQNMAPEGSNIHLPILSSDYHQRNLLPLKRKGSVLDNEHPVEDYQDDQGGVNDIDPHFYAKRFKFDANTSGGEQILVPQFGNELVENLSELITRITERESCPVETNVQVGLGECCSLENGRDNLVATENFECSADANDDFQQKQWGSVNNANGILECISEGGAQQCILEDEVNVTKFRASNVALSLKTIENISLDENKDDNDTVNQFKSQNIASLNVLTPGSIAENLKIRMKNLFQEDTSSHEKIDVTTEKSHLLSSDCTPSHASPSNWTELDLCLKCSKDGQLLICNAANCPFAVHDKCLGCSPKFDEKGNFYCPFCGYSYSISKYHEAKEKTSLARKELAAFIREHPKRSRIRKRCNLEHNQEVGTLHKTHETGDLSEREFDQTSNKEHEANGISQNCPEANGSKEMDLGGLDRRSNLRT